MSSWWLAEEAPTHAHVRVDEPDVEIVGAGITGISAALTFVANPADGSVMPASTYTDGTGSATVTWTLGSAIGAQSLHVNVAGTYTFVNATDDDGYLFVNGQLVASDPGGHGVQNAFLGGTGGTNRGVRSCLGSRYHAHARNRGGSGRTLRRDGR